MNPPTDQPVVILISANSEWQPVLENFQQPALQQTPFGGFFSLKQGNFDLVFMKSGWGKISAAASTQYSILKFEPKLVINLGTCGGLAGQIQRGEILLVEKTLIYDLHERMGDPDEAVRFYSTSLDLSFLSEPFPIPVHRGQLLSADQDIDPEKVPWLISKYHAVAADWESGAIAWTAQQNHVPCLILRGVTDLVSLQKGEIYNGIEAFQQRADEMMKTLLRSLPAWLDCVDLTKKSAG